MVLKYNFTLPEGNFFNESIKFVNAQVSGLFMYTVLLVIWGVLLYRYQRTTQDLDLEIIRSMFAINILGIIVYYWGVSVDSVFVSGTILIFTVLFNVLGGGFLYYQRSNDD